MKDRHLTVEYVCPEHLYPAKEHVYCWKQFSLQERLIVPEPKPNIEDLLEVNVKPIIKKCKLLDTPWAKKLVIIGEVEQKIIYVADVATQSVHSFHATQPFCTFIEISHGSDCLSSQHHLFYEPRVVVEYLCTQKIDQREVAKCLILLVWFHHRVHPGFITPGEDSLCDDSPWGNSNDCVTVRTS